MKKPVISQQAWRSNRRFRRWILISTTLLLFSFALLMALIIYPLA